MTIGEIQLDLVINNTIGKQVQDAADKAKKPAEAAFSAVGEVISSAVSKPMEAAQASIKKSLDGIDKRVDETKKKFKGIDNMSDAELHDLNPEFRKSPKDIGETTMAWKKSPALQTAPEKPAPKIGETFSVASDAVGLLNQKLDITYAQLGEQEAKLKQLAQQYAEVAAEKGDGSGAAKAIESQITAVQAKLVSLQQTAMGTQAKLDKALDSSAAADKTAVAIKAAQEKAAASVKAAQEKAAAAVEAANAKIKASSNKTAQKVKGVFKSIASGIGGAFKKAGSAVGKQLGGIQKKAHGLSKSVKSAFKSAFLMAGLYAAFRGIKSLIGGAVGQNEEFAKSLNLIKANLLTAFTPIVQAVQPALNALAGGFAAISKQIATATAGMFGQTYAQATAATKKMQTVTKEAKKASGTLAGIDELNTLDSGASDQDNGTDLGALDTAKYDDAAGFGAKVTDMLSKLAAGIGPAIAGILGKISGAAPQFAAAAATVVKSLLSGFNGNFSKITESGISILNSLLSGLESVLPELGPFVTNVIDLMLQAFLTYAPSLFSMGVTLLGDVIRGLADRMPELIPMAKEAIRTIMDALTKNLPIILQSGIDILLALAEGISDMLPELIPAAIDCILTLVQGLLDNLPDIIQAAIDLIMALAFGLIDALPILLEKAPDIIQALVDGLIDAIPMLVDAAVKLLMKLVDFVINNLDMIFTLGPKIMIKLADSLVKAIPKLFDAAKKMPTAIVNKIKETDWLEVGKNIIKGIGDGLLNGVKNIAGTIKDAATGLIDGFKGFLGIHSPSKVFADIIGKNMALGIGEGFTDEMGAVESMMGKAVPDLTAAVQAPSLGITSGARAGYATAPAAVQQPQTGGANDTRAAQVLELLMRILEAIEGIDPQLILDGTTFGRLINPYIKKDDRRKGNPVVRVV
jgi:phage-related protein